MYIIFDMYIIISGGSIRLMLSMKYSLYRVSYPMYFILYIKNIPYVPHNCHVSLNLQRINASHAQYEIHNLYRVHILCILYYIKNISLIFVIFPRKFMYFAFHLSFLKITNMILGYFR